MLLGAAIRTSPGSLAEKLSWCKEGMPAPYRRSGARVFAVMAGVNLVIRVSWYKFYKWPGIDPGAQMI